MAVKKIVQHPSKYLNSRCIEVRDVSTVLDLIQDLQDTLQKSKVAGAGLAAPQVGVLKRVFIARKYYVNNEGVEDFEEIAFINPEIIKSSKKTQKSLEGCLSIKDTYGFVNRSKQIKIKYIDKNGRSVVKGASGFYACVLQHELDHLNGVLFTEKLIGNKVYSEKEIDKYISENS